MAAVSCRRPGTLRGTGYGHGTPPSDGPAPPRATRTTRTGAAPAPAQRRGRAPAVAGTRPEPVLLSSHAEGVGFEPTVTRGHDSFQDCSLRPIGQPSWRRSA